MKFVIVIFSWLIIGSTMAQAGEHPENDGINWNVQCRIQSGTLGSSLEPLTLKAQKVSGFIAPSTYQWQPYGQIFIAVTLQLGDPMVGNTGTVLMTKDTFENRFFVGSWELHENAINLPNSNGFSGRIFVRDPITTEPYTFTCKNGDY